MIDGVYVLLAIKYGFWKYAIFSLGPCEKFSFFGLFQPQNKCLQYASYKPTGNFFVAEFRLKTRVAGERVLRRARMRCRIEYIICPCSMPIFFSLFMAAKSSWEGSRQQLLKEARKWAQKRGTGPISHSTRAEQKQCFRKTNQQLPN